MRSGPRSIVLILSAWLTTGIAQCANATPPAPTARAGRNVPIFKIVEGAKGSPDPYSPRVLNVPAGREVALDITDYIGGCALVTVFPRLGPKGQTVRARVPVGQTRRVLIFAAKPGRFRYHCAGDMYFGEIVAR